MGCHFLLQGIFLTQGSNPSLPHIRQILYHLSHQGSPMYIYIHIAPAVCIHIPLPLKPRSHAPTPAIWIITEHRAECPVLPPLPTSCLFHTQCCVQVSATLSIWPTFSPGCVRRSTLYICILYYCHVNRFISTIFLDSTYTC